jgi:transposase
VAAVDPKDARIAELEAQVAARDEVIARLMAKVEALTARVAELEARLNQNSNHSSRPPSSDAPGPPRQPKKPTGRRPGGQPSHKKHERALLRTEDGQHVVELVPSQCRGCKRRLHGRDTVPRRHQAVEVPAHARNVFGDRLAALASLLVGKYRLSKRLVKGALSDMLGVELSVGSVSNLEGEIADALAPSVAEALAYVQSSDAANADETGFAQGRESSRARRAWLWVGHCAGGGIPHCQTLPQQGRPPSARRDASPVALVAR